MLSLLALALQAAQAVPPPATFDLAQAPISIDRTATTRCGATASSDDIVICGQRRDRYRLPLPKQREPASDHVRGEAPSGMAAITPSGRCGIFAGERQCNKREAAQYGYGRGRDPITLLTRMAEKVADPDAD